MCPHPGRRSLTLSSLWWAHKRTRTIRLCMYVYGLFNARYWSSPRTAGWCQRRKNKNESRVECLPCDLRCSVDLLPKRSGLEDWYLEYVRITDGMATRTCSSSFLHYTIIYYYIFYITGTTITNTTTTTITISLLLLYLYYNYYYNIIVILLLLRLLYCCCHRRAFLFTLTLLPCLFDLFWSYRLPTGLNNAGCGYDGGDCCKASCEVCNQQVASLYTWPN